MMMSDTSKFLDDGTLQMTTFVKRGPMLVRRSALDLSDPDHPVNVIERLGGDPDLYGYGAARLERDTRSALDPEWERSRS
jgi:hypothetical protein